MLAFPDSWPEVQSRPYAGPVLTTPVKKRLSKECSFISFAACEAVYVRKQQESSTSRGQKAQMPEANEHWM